MRTAVAFAAVAALSSAARALPAGVFVLAGVPVNAQNTSESSDGSATIRIGPLYGPHLQAGFEVGEYLNNQFMLVLSYGGGPATHSADPAVKMTVGVLQYAAGYQLTWDVLGKSGLTPYAGAGFYLGRADLGVTGTRGSITAGKEGTVTTLELHAVLGLRHTMASGLALRAEVAASTYGGFGAWIPSLGASWRL